MDTTNLREHPINPGIRWRCCRIGDGSVMMLPPGVQSSSEKCSRLLKLTRIFDDVMSGTRSDRPGLAAALDYVREGDTLVVPALDYVREGDTLVVPALDRLGRSLVDTINTLDALRNRGIYVRALREGIDTSTPAGRMVAGVFASLAELERELIHERATVAREAAKARGKQTGRPKSLTDEQAGVARRMRENGESVSTITETLGISRATFYRVLADREADSS